MELQGLAPLQVSYRTCVSCTLVLYMLPVSSGLMCVCLFQENTVEIQPVEMAAYPTDGVNLLESEEVSVCLSVSRYLSLIHTL